MNLERKPGKTEPSALPWSDELDDAIVAPRPIWQAPGYSALHYAMVGLLLGAVGGCTSLVANIIGSVLWPAISGEAQHPLRLIQVYLTFPLGESALALDGGVLLALGCVLYLITGMLYGMLFVLAMSYLVPNAGVRARLFACGILALLVWSVNFYLLLSWMQPLLLGGRWIAELIPWWVGALTHLVFGCTVALLYPIATPKSANRAVNNGVAA